MLDLNDCVPEFNTSGIYDVTIMEEAELGFSVLQVETTDNDSNGEQVLMTFRFRFKILFRIYNDSKVLNVQ